MIKQIAHKTRPRKLFYAYNVNMNLSFDRLNELGKKLLGADLQIGDILICDNAKGDKRKVMQWTEKGFIIYYARYHDQLFDRLAEHNGQLKNLQKVEIIG